MKELTPKQERFAQLCVTLGNQSEAYRQAYDVGESTPDKSIWVLASKEMTKVNVRLRVVSIKNEVGNQYRIERGYIVTGLLDIINDAEYTFELAKLENADKDETKRFFRMMQQTKNTDKLRALEQLAKMLGLNEPDRLETKDTSYKTNWGE